MSRTALGEICDIVMGQSPPSSTYNSDGEGFPFFQGKTDFGAVYPSVRVYCKKPNKVAEPGDVLLSVRAPVGPTNRARLRSAIGRGLAAIRARPGVSQEFVYRYLQFAEPRLAAKGLGSTFEAVSRDDIETLEVSLPSLAEQQQIGEVLNRADRLLRIRRYALDLSEGLVGAAFLETFGDRSYGPSVSIERERGGLPRGWTYRKLTDVARLATGHTPDRREPAYWGGDIPWVTLTDIRSLDGRIATSTSESVTQAGIDNSSAVRLPSGTVCFSRTASVGFVTIMGREMCTSQDFVNWVCGADLNPIYLAQALTASRTYLRSLSAGSTHQTIYFPTVEEFRVVLPPRQLQDRFAEQFHTSTKLCAAEAEGLRQAEHLFQTLLHEAFGEG